MERRNDGWEAFARYRDTSLPLRQREAAFELLVNQEKTYVEYAARTVVSEICNGKPPRGFDAEQMALDAFFILAMKSGSVTASPKSYIWGVLRILARRFKDKGNRRLDGRALSVEFLVAEPGSVHPDSEEVLLEERVRISEAIVNLSPALQEVIELYNFQGFEFEEIDSLLGLKSGAARQRHCRARMKLAQLLVEPFYGAAREREATRSDEPELD